MSNDSHRLDGLNVADEEMDDEDDVDDDDDCEWRCDEDGPRLL